MATVVASSRGVAHKGSGGMSTVFPDVCKTPTPAEPIPIPYPNIGQRSCLSRPGLSATSKRTAHMVVHPTY